MSKRSFKTADRLIAALNRLLSREEAAVRAGSGLRVRALQSRIAPLIATLARLGEESPGHEFSRGIVPLVEKRRQNMLLMKESLATIRREINARAEMLGRIRRVSPAYNPQVKIASRLNATS